MNVWTVALTSLVFISTCYCFEHIQCGTHHVLGSTTLTLYGLENEKMSVVPMDVNDTTVRWKIVPRQVSSLVRVVYRRLVIRGVSGVAGSHIMYNLWKGDNRIFTSGKARIEVGESPSLRFNASHYKVQSGHNIKICYTITGSPNAIISLYKGDSTNLLNTDPRFHIQDSCLTIDSVLLDDRGIYVMKVENCFNSADAKFRLKVVEKPRVAILSTANHIHVPVNSQLTVYYNFSGRPVPSLQWFHNRSIIHPSKYTGSNLHLNKISFTDSGVYKVVVTNSVGKAEASLTLSVHLQQSKTVTTPTQQYKTPTLEKDQIEQISPTPQEMFTERKSNATGYKTNPTENTPLTSSPENSTDEKPSYQPPEQIADPTEQTSHNRQTTVVSHKPSPTRGIGEKHTVNDEMQSFGCNNPENSRSQNCDDEKNLFSKWWFLAALGSGFVAMLLVILILIICIKTRCCQSRREKDTETDKDARKEINECNISIPINGQEEIMYTTKFPNNVNHYEVPENDDIEDDYDHITPKSESIQQPGDDEPQYETVPAEI